MSKLVRVSDDQHERLEQLKLVDSETYGNVVKRALDVLEEKQSEDTDK